MTLVPKRVLVTGGAGFLGSHLCERLVRQGDDVLCVDNYFTGRKDNIAHLLGESRFEAMRHDITFPLFVEVDEIYNLACPASPVHYQYDPVQTTKTSVIGAINMLGLAKRIGAKIVQASTSEVYGDPTVHPQTEDYRGNVNPMGAARVLRRGQALRRDAVLRLPAPAPDPDQGGAHLQHLWASNGSERRARDFEFHHAGAAQSAAHDLWRRQPDPVVLLRRRSGGRIGMRLMATGNDVTGPINICRQSYHEVAVRELAGGGWFG